MGAGYLQRVSEETIRAAVAADLDALTRIYNHYVVETAITFDTEPYEAIARRPWLEQFAETGPHRLVVAADSADRVIGYAGSHRFRPKAAYDTTVEVTVYLAPEVQQKGLGTRLYQALFRRLEGQDLHRAVAGVTLPNPASLALHARFGFTDCGVQSEVGRKLGRYWDVQWLEKQLGG